MCFARLTTRLLRRFGRGVVIWLCVASFAITASGVPVPDAPRWGRAPFPCQGHRCGCASADQCWKQCCCFTPREKLAWAERNNVAPPAETIASAKASCCTSHALPVAPSSCCATPKHSRDDDRWVFAIRAQKCHGAATEWLSLGAVVAGLEFASPPAALVAGDVIDVLNEAALMDAERPDAPPPKAWHS